MSNKSLIFLGFLSAAAAAALFVSMAYFFGTWPIAIVVAALLTVVGLNTLSQKVFITLGDRFTPGSRMRIFLAAAALGGRKWSFVALLAFAAAAVTIAYLGRLHRVFPLELAGLLLMFVAMFAVNVRTLHKAIHREGDGASTVASAVR